MCCDDSNADIVDGDQQQSSGSDYREYDSIGKYPSSFLDDIEEIVMEQDEDRKQYLMQREEKRKQRGQELDDYDYDYEMKDW